MVFLVSLAFEVIAELGVEVVAECEDLTIGQQNHRVTTSGGHVTNCDVIRRRGVKGDAMRAGLVRFGPTSKSGDFMN